MFWSRGHGIDLGAPIKGFPARAQRQRVGWGEEEQGSGRSFRRQAETETSGLCDDDGAAPNGAYKRFVPRTRPWRKGGSAALSSSIPTGPRKMEHFAGPIPWPLLLPLWPETEILPQVLLAGPHTGGPLCFGLVPWNRPRGPIADGAARKRRTSVLSPGQNLGGRAALPP